MWWRIAKENGIPLNSGLEDLQDFPHTLVYVIMKRMQIDSFAELPKKDRPPERIWDDAEALEDWFDRIRSPDKDTGITIDVKDIEG